MFMFIQKALHLRYVCYLITFQSSLWVLYKLPMRILFPRDFPVWGMQWDGIRKLVLKLSLVGWVQVGKGQLSSDSFPSLYIAFLSKLWWGSNKMIWENLLKTTKPLRGVRGNSSLELSPGFMEKLAPCPISCKISGLGRGWREVRDWFISYFALTQWQYKWVNRTSVLVYDLLSSTITCYWKCFSLLTRNV